MSEYITLTEDARLHIVVDEDAECPRLDWDMRTGFVKITDRGDTRLADVIAVHPDRIGIAEAHRRFDEDRYTWVQNVGSYTIKHRRNPEDDTLPRWAKIFHGLNVQYDSQHGGYWFVQMDEEWSADYTGQGEVIREEQETYRQWAESEVAIVCLERTVTRQISTTHADGSITRSIEEGWEEIESLGGCYLGEDYTAQTVAREHFTLTEEELAALTKENA